MNEIKFLMTFLAFLYILNFFTNRNARKNYNKFQQYLDKRGAEGEHQVAYELKKYICKGNLYKSVYIPIEAGRDTEIDLLLVNCYGVFVIESKNWNGSITGKEDGDKWIFSNTLGDSFMDNPCKQNEYHLKRLKEYLDINKDTYHSIIVFGYDSTLDFYPKNNCKSVLGIKELEKYMDSMINKEKILSDEEIKYIDTKIKSCIDKDDKYKEKHVQRVKALRAR
ncbi:MAG: NERD domain-containing protein [Clostridium sp.]|nr:NERD domain-containing protein [Clostridium sp.]